MILLNLWDHFQSNCILNIWIWEKKFFFCFFFRDLRFFGGKLKSTVFIGFSCKWYHWKGIAIKYCYAFTELKNIVRCDLRSILKISIQNCIFRRNLWMNSNINNIIRLLRSFTIKLHTKYLNLRKKVFFLFFFPRFENFWWKINFHSFHWIFLWMVSLDRYLQ
jgi:hypothetical protein